jgi:hypothetical protein
MIWEAFAMRASAILVLLASLLPVAAFAAEEQAKPAKKTAEPGTHVTMPFLIAPVVENGKLTGYSYINSKLIASTPAASVEIREKLAFIQDAFVREVNARPIGKPGDPRTVDTVALAKRLVADAQRIVGARKVVTITFSQIQFSPIHPKNSTEDAIPPSQRAPNPPDGAASDAAAVPAQPQSASPASENAKSP